MCSWFIFLTLNMTHVQGKIKWKVQLVRVCLPFPRNSILQRLTSSPSGSSVRRARNDLAEQRGSTSTTGCITSYDATADSVFVTSACRPSSRRGSWQAPRETLLSSAKGSHTGRMVRALLTSIWQAVAIAKQWQRCKSRLETLANC